MEHINDNIEVLPIGEEQVKEAFKTLQKYKAGKAQLENRIIENEQWWKLKQREYFKEGDKQELKPTSAWLFNCVISKHADAMDSYPEPNILPRERGDMQEAENLSHILPVVLQHNGYQKTYSDCWWNKIKNGTGAYGVFWDANKLNGLGDISIKKIDLLSLFWEPGISDIQKSRNIFYVTLMDKDLVEEKYPQAKDHLNSETGIVSKYIYDDTVDTTDKTLIVDWYYKKWDAEQKKEILHFVKFCNDVVLFATENQPEQFPNGLYDHGRYPFEFDVMFPVEGSPAGFGFVDIGKSPQKYIDLLDQAFLTNTLAGATPRHFVSEAAGINIDDMLDVSKPVVRASSGANLNEMVKPFPSVSLPGIYFNVLQSKIDELKETTGNRDVNSGGTVSGVTSGTAIAALQEQGGKLSRDMIMTTYDCYERIILMCIELIRQFYNQPRQFRILGENGKPDFVSFSNEGIQPVHQGIDFGMDMGYRVPVFDVEVSAQKENLYTKTAYNEFALQLYQNGFFNPEMATQALSALDLMDFEGKTDVSQKIKQNGDLQAMLLQWQQLALTLASKYEPQMAEGLASNIMGGAMPMPNASAPSDASLEEGKEDTRTANARQAAQERARPR